MKSARRKLGIELGKTYALKGTRGNVINHFDDTEKAAEFYTDLHSTESSHATFIGSSDGQDTEAPSIISVGVRMALRDMSRGKTAREDEITEDIIKDGGDIVTKAKSRRRIYLQNIYKKRRVREDL